MPNDESPRPRLRYYGRGDYATYYQIERATQMMLDLDAGREDYSLNDVIELHHAAQFVEHGLFLQSTSEEEKQRAIENVATVKQIVGTFFSQLNDGTVAQKLTEIDHQYRGDVLELFSRNRVYERCTAATLLPSLQAARLHLGDLLTSRDLVKTYDEDVRTLLLASTDNAEQVIIHHLLADARHATFLPASLTANDQRQLIDAYIESDGPNPNYLKLVANARPSRESGINPLLKLNAQRAYDAYWARHFETNEGIKTGAEVSIADDQTEEAKATLDGLVARYSYSRQWLTENLDYPTILNNFVYLFDFSNVHMLLNFPSFYAQLGVFERFMVTAGRDEYRTGAAFTQQHQASMLQTIMYDQFLRSEGVELEQVVEWFFTDYLPAEFGAIGFRFRAASPGSTFLEKSRHLFSEMESVLKQFTLYVENGDLDPELLAMTSEQLSYRAIPSLLSDGKYLYVSDDVDIQRVQHLLFSDQSLMGYINEELNERTFAELLESQTVTYDSFEEHQRDDLDFLIDQGIVASSSDGGSLTFRSRAQFAVLKCLNDFESASGHHFSAGAQEEIRKMREKGWLDSSDTLLTRSESSFFNYMLNQSEFTNGPDLRNRYLHGSQADGEDNRVHFQTYIEVLRLLIALVIKVNDDFALSTEEQESDEP